MISPKTRPILSSEGAVFTAKKPMGILVRRNLLRALLYLISPALRILEVIIRKNAEPGRNYSTMPDGNA